MGTWPLSRREASLARSEHPLSNLAGQLSLSLEVGEAAGNRTSEVFVTDAASAEEPLEVAFISGS